MKKLLLTACLLAGLSSGAGAQTAPVYTDLWWNANESGWGINLNHQGDIIFATWFTYGGGSRAAWYVVSDARRQPDGSFTGRIYQTTGVPFNQISGAQSSRTVTDVGPVVFRFTGSSAGTFTYTVNGVTQTKNITRQQYASQPTTCTAQAASTSRAASQNYQDMWWVPAESGWGLNLTHQADNIFAAWFTYDTSGNPNWVVGSNVARQADGSYSGQLYRTTGVPFNLINGQPSSQSVTAAGTITLRFTDGERGTMTYTLDGVSGSKAIVRQVFGSTVGLCTNPASTTTPSGNPGNPGTPSQPTGNCASTINLSAGNRYDYRTTPTGAAASESRQQVIGSGTFGGKSAVVVEVRNLVGGQPDASGYSRIYYEDTGNTFGVIGSETYDGGGSKIATTTYSPVDYQPKNMSVGQSVSGSYRASTTASASGFQTTSITDYSYSGRVSGNETVVVPAGTFSTCKFQLDNVSTSTNFSISGIAFGGYNFTCSGTGTANAAAIGSVRNSIDLAACSGSLAGGASPPPIRSTTELIRATVNGSSYP